MAVLCNAHSRATAPPAGKMNEMTRSKIHSIYCSRVKDPIQSRVELPNTRGRMITRAVTSHNREAETPTPPSHKATKAAAMSIRPVPLIRRQQTPHSTSPGADTASLATTLHPGTLTTITPGDGVIGGSHANNTPTTTTLTVAPGLRRESSQMTRILAARFGLFTA